MTLGRSALKVLSTPNASLDYYAIRSLEDSLIPDVSHFPYSIRVLIENVLRNSDGGSATDDHVKLVTSWSSSNQPTSEFPYMPARVLLQDFTGIPVITDLAAMRDAVADSGQDTSIINPIVPTHMVVDHSVQVDYFGRSDALAGNMRREFERNKERYQLLKWAQSSFSNLRIIPPGVGIVHQVNLEHLATVVTQKGGAIFPDTCIGTDSHTTMVNGLGVLGWGVGGIEAEAVMLGQPYYMLMPEVVGVKLTGAMPETATATDLVLTITETLRNLGVVEKFVEFYGTALSQLTLADRATIANMSPEYGATCGFFPIDEQTLRYLRLTGRSADAVDVVERYAKENALWHETSSFPHYTQEIEFDMSQVIPSLAGPRRPQDRVSLPDVSENFRTNFQTNNRQSEISGNGKKSEVKDGSVVIASITSCTNTSNPAAMVGAGLLARKALAKGLTKKSWVKTSLAPGSRVVTKYLEEAGLDKYLDSLGFHTVGYGCTTCIGNSGPLPDTVSRAVEDFNLSVVAVLSGNRNFAGRIHPQVVASYLASPMLVVAYALAGSVETDIVNEPLGTDEGGNPVMLKDIWPSREEIADTVTKFVKSDMFREQYSDTVNHGPEEWQHMSAPRGKTFAWDAGSTYIQKPTYFEDFKMQPDARTDLKLARVLVHLADSVTTDHISPAGAIPPSTPAGQYLMGNDVPRSSFNTYGARRGNHDVMVRGTFGNIRLRNKLTPDMEGDWTLHFPSGELMRVFDAAMLYKSVGTPLIVLAGREYGTGSSRDWAAKGPMLLGVRAVIAQSYERIHRSNLVGMGILPLQFTNGESAESLGLTGGEMFDITGSGTDDISVNAILRVTATTETGFKTTFSTQARLDTNIEVDYYRHGGLLLYVLRKMLTVG